MDTKQIVFTDYAKAELLTMPLADIGAGDVLVKTAYTAVSAGTERANILGDTAVPGMRGKDVKNVFPRMLGYSGTGIVEKTGALVTAVHPGDRVMCYWGTHSQRMVLPENQVILMDKNVKLLDAAFVFIGTFPLAAVRKTGVETGESALVMGLGLLGLMSVQLMRIAGAAPVIAVDPNEERQALALKLGADYALSPLDADFEEKVRSLTDGRGAAAVIDSTGVGQALNQALRCTAKMGRVALLGCTRKPTEVDFYYDVHIPGIALYGAHTFARPDHESYPRHWTHRDDCKALMKLMAYDRLDLGALIHQICSPLDSPAVYRKLADDPDFPVGVAFDWIKLDE